MRSSGLQRNNTPFPYIFETALIPYIYSLFFASIVHICTIDNSPLYHRHSLQWCVKITSPTSQVKLFTNFKQLKFDIIEGNRDVIAFADDEALRKGFFSNAVKYSKKIIHVTIKCDNANFWVVVENDGDLIPLHLKKKIFEPFFRLSADEQSTGTGIGLSLAYSLIELHIVSVVLYNRYSWSLTWYST